MNALMDHLRRRVEQTRQELEENRRIVQQARATDEMLVAELAGYEKALSAEERREGRATVLVVQEPEAAADLEVEPEATVNKTAFAWDVLRSGNGAGVSAPELFKAFESAGITLHRNYVYSILNRLAAKGKIKERRGRYFPVVGGQEVEGKQ